MIFLLEGLSPGDHKGVYTSRRALRKGIDSWIKLRPEETLTYTEWENNYPYEPDSIGFGYIAPSGLIPRGCTMTIPSKKYWGLNLLIPKWSEEVYKDYVKQHE